MHEKRHFLSYRKRRHDVKIMCTYAHYVTLVSHCKMASSSSEDETDTWPERPSRIQPYQFEPVRQDSERVQEHRVSSRYTFIVRFISGVLQPASVLFAQKEVLLASNSALIYGMQ